ncbi:hypothetical protein N0V90_000342 [Kalmusia sp. IMI 367209]|nr:hypothetical protein N0V90_000342 [Kalmusia sp. IMI 367209]
MEVESEGLSEVLSSLHALILPEQQSKIFNIPELDILLPSSTPPLLQPLQQHPRSDDDIWDPNQQRQTEAFRPAAPSREKKKTIRPVLELVSPSPAYHPSPAGKTSLIHLIITHAILPASLSTIPLSGLDAAVILFDPLHHFSTAFLATTLFSHTISRFQEGEKDIHDEATKKEIHQCIKRSLSHVHIFRPSSWDSLLSTLRQLPDYLFSPHRHTSTHRAIHSIILEDIDAFVPAIRGTSSFSNPQANPLSTASSQLTLQLENLATLLSCAVVSTSRSTSSTSFRAALPLSWPPRMQLTRLAVRRMETVKFAPGISVEEAEQERAQRWGVVSRGRFEAWKVGQGPRESEAFVFTVGRSVQIEQGLE